LRDANGYHLLGGCGRAAAKTVVRVYKIDEMNDFSKYRNGVASADVVRV
jgi:hypothetical protein